MNELFGFALVLIVVVAILVAEWKSTFEKGR